MFKVKRLISLIAFSLTVAAAGASAQQDTLHNKILISYVTQKADWVSVDGLSSTKGISAGYVRTCPLGVRAGLSLEYGGNVTWLHGIEKSGSNGSVTLRADFLSVSLPVNIAREFRIGASGVSVAPFLGPNFKYNIIGKYHEAWRDEDGRKTRWTNYLSREQRNPASIFQFGADMGVRLTYGRLVFAYTFQPDFTDYVKDDTYYCQHTVSNALSVGFRF